MKPFKLLLMLSLLVPILYAQEPDKSSDPKNWLYYQEQQEAKKKPKKPKTPVTVAPKPKEKLQEIKITDENDIKQPFSAAWFREKLPEIRDLAISNPTYENVRAYKYMERIALDMSSRYAQMSEEVLRKDPLLDENVRFPIASIARQQAFIKIDKAKKLILKDLANKTGIWFFFDSACHFCVAQYDILKTWEQYYPEINVSYISSDGKALKGMPPKKIKQDNNQAVAKMLGLKVTPAIVLVAPPDKIAIVSHGTSAMQELEEKIILAAIDLNLVDKNLIDVVQLQERGILNQDDLNTIRNELDIENSDNIEAIVKLVNKRLQKKY